MVEMRILLVEDEPRAAQMLAKGLREQGYRVTQSTPLQMARGPYIRRLLPSTTRSSSTSCSRGRTGWRSAVRSGERVPSFPS
jgi:hypothetical protein